MEVVETYAPAEAVLRQVEGALISHAQLELQRSSEEIRKAIQNESLDPKQTEDVLAANARATTTIKSFLDACLNSFPSSMRPTSTLHIKAEQVFSTPELL